MAKAFCECGRELKAETDGRTFFLCWEHHTKSALGDQVAFQRPGDKTRLYEVTEVNDNSEHYGVRLVNDVNSRPVVKGMAYVAYAGELRTGEHSLKLARENDNG